MFISTHTLTWSVTFSYRQHCPHSSRISTHTLTWSVTARENYICYFEYISTHTLTWSVTLTDYEYLMKQRDFNSHAHVERDWQWHLTNSSKSTFQLTRSRGAWQYIYMFFLLGPLFQLTRSRGAWLHEACSRIHGKHFNSHAHVERDTAETAIREELENFNSHAHVERDITLTICRNSRKISTHTLTWSVTTCIYNSSHIHQISTHTLTWSVTYIRNRTWRTFNNFNSHAHVERDIHALSSISAIQISTHTLTWSVTKSIAFISFLPEFQLTRSRGAWPWNLVLNYLLVISTHTLTWSVTFSHGSVSNCGKISTHTLTWSVTWTR